MYEFRIYLHSWAEDTNTVMHDRKEASKGFTGLTFSNATSKCTRNQTNTIYLYIIQLNEKEKTHKWSQDFFLNNTKTD